MNRKYSTIRKIVDNSIGWIPIIIQVMLGIFPTLVGLTASKLFPSNILLQWKKRKVKEMMVDYFDRAMISTRVKIPKRIIIGVRLNDNKVADMGELWQAILDLEETVERSKE